MLRRQMLWVAAVSLCGAIAAVSSLNLAYAQGLKAPDDPFEDIDLESLKKDKGAARAPAPSTPAEVAPAPSVPPSKELQLLFSNARVDDDLSAVQNRPTRATTFTLGQPTWIAGIATVHRNKGRGAPPGTIALRSSSGEVFGPWRAIAAPDATGLQNAGWAVKLDIVLPAGTYTVIDSDPATWSHNATSGGAGIAAVMGNSGTAQNAPPTVTKSAPSADTGVAPMAAPSERTRSPQQVVEAARGATERKVILDVVRASVERRLGIKVTFVVERLATFGEWAYADLHPRTEAGKRIDYRKTRYAQNYHPDFDSDSVDVLLRRSGDAWIIVQEAFLPGDVVWEEWERQYNLPRRLFLAEGRE